MPSKLKQEPVQKIKLKTYFRPKDAHLKTVKLSRSEISLILSGLKALRYNVTKKYDPDFVPEEGKFDANLSTIIRCDAVFEIFLHHLESFKNDR